MTASRVNRAWVSLEERLARIAGPTADRRPKIPWSTIEALEDPRDVFSVCRALIKDEARVDFGPDGFPYPGHRP